MAIEGTTPVPTIKGWIMARELREGDYVFDKEGMPAKVTLVHTYIPKTMWRVGLNDGLAVVCDEQAVFPVETKMLRNWVAIREHKDKKGKYHWKKTKRRELVEYRPLRDIVVADKLSIPTTKPIHFREEPHPVPPFVVGLWFSSRSKRGTVTIHDEHLEYVTARLKQYGYALKRAGRNYYKITPSVSQGLLARYTPMPTTTPEHYFVGTPEQRLDLLRGYVLARSHVYNLDKDTFTIRAVAYTLPRQIQILCESLGMRTVLQETDSAKANWMLTFRTRLKVVPNQKLGMFISRHERRSITSVEEIEPRLCAHIKTEAASFAVGEGYIQCR